MRRIVAFVSAQPAAVLSPLSAAELAPEPGDSVVLLAGDPAAPGPEAVARALRASCPGASVEVAGVRDGAVAALLARYANPTDELVVLANGGRLAWSVEALEWALAAGRDLEVAVSRDDRGYLFRPLGGAARTFGIPEVPVDDVLAVLGLEYRQGRAELVHLASDRVLPGVVELRARAGQLFVALDVVRWRRLIAALNNRAVDAYRFVVLDQVRLQSFGLERRRLHLRRVSASLFRRAEEDGVPAEAPEGGSPSPWATTPDEWRQWIADGAAFALADELATAHETPQPLLEGPATDGPAAWEGKPLIVIAGTEPETTALAAWTHRPRSLVLLADETSPSAARSAARLQREAVEAGCPQVHVVEAPPRDAPDPVGQLEKTLASWSDAEVDVNVTPGDKWPSLVLATWALRGPTLRQIWEVDPQSRDGAVRRLGATARKEAHTVPLATRLALRAPGPLAVRGARWSMDDGEQPPDALQRAARDLAAWVAGHRSISGLDRFGVRTLPPCIGKDDLVLSTGERVPLGTLLEAGAESFVRSLKAREASGFWFEWVTALALAAAGADEVVMEAVVEGPEGSTRDEVDAVTRCGPQACAWSCKLSALGLAQQFRVSRAQATRLLGRAANAVLVVPRLPAQAHVPGLPEMVEKAPGRWFDAYRGSLIDARLLAGDAARLREVAGSTLLVR